MLRGTKPAPLDNVFPECVQYFVVGRWCLSCGGRKGNVFYLHLCLFGRADCLFIFFRIWTSRNEIFEESFWGQKNLIHQFIVYIYFSKEFCVKKKWKIIAVEIFNLLLPVYWDWDPMSWLIFEQWKMVCSAVTTLILVF